MTLARWVCVLCNVCGSDGPTARTPLEARAAARRDGWRILPAAVDLCPEHRDTTIADIRRLQIRMAAPA